MFNRYQNRVIERLEFLLRRLEQPLTQADFLTDARLELDRSEAAWPADKAAMNDLLSSDPPAGRSEQAHAFLQRYAVDILDLMRPKDDAALGEQLISISTEINKPDLIALHSMARLGRMSQEMQGKVAEPADVLGSWAARVLKAFESELARLQALERPVRCWRR